MLDTALSSNILNCTEDPPPPVEIKGEVEYEIAIEIYKPLSICGWDRSCWYADTTPVLN